MDRDELLAKIAGQVVMNPNPGGVLRSWRMRLQVKQSALAQAMKVSPSVLSDYESGRRLSPGVSFVKRYVEALINLDEADRRLFSRLVDEGDRTAILSIGEFRNPVTSRRVAELLNLRILKGEEQLDNLMYGYTVLDSIRTIYALSGLDFYRIFGASTERALLFTKVGLGRSPLVAVRVCPLKPRMVVLHGPKEVDNLALDLAERERIVLALATEGDEKTFSQVLDRL